MAWQGILGHDAIAERFRRSLAAGRLPSTFLFVGPAGIGKRTFALKLAQGLLCQARDETLLDPCGKCSSCVQVAAGTHPDLLRVAKPGDKSFIPLSLIIGDDAHRMREGLCHDIALKPFMGGRRVAIIDDADYLNEEGANALLKTLEEPPPRSVLILIGTSAERQLPTIRSRAQLVRFQPLAPELAMELILSEGIVSDRAAAARLAEHCEGSLERAAELVDEALWAFRVRLLNGLSARPLESVALGKSIGAFVDEAGKDASARRARSRQVIGFAADFFRQSVRAAAGLPPVGDADLQEAIARALATPGGQDEAADCLDRTLEALAQVDRNANQAALLECWTDELGQILAGRPIVLEY